MGFSIQFYEDEEDNQNCLGSIFLDNWEDFNSFTGQFSRDQYEAQWEEAVRLALIERRTTALFKSIEIEDDGTGVLWLYPVIPSELAGDSDSKVARLSNFPDQDDAGVYLSERFIFVTIKASNFERRIYTPAPELP